MRRLLLAVLLVPALAQAGPFSPPGTPRRYHRDHVTDVTHLRLDVKVDLVAGSVAGRSTLSITLLRDAAEFPLDAADMTVASVTTGGKALAYSHKSPVLTIAVPEGARAGSSFDVAIDYTARPRRGMYFVRPEKGYPDRPWEAWSQGEAEDNRYWFPCWDTPEDRYTTEIAATVKKPFMAISNGALLSVSDAEPGWRTYHWSEQHEHASYLVSLVVGDYQKLDLPGATVPVMVYAHERDTRDWHRSFDQTVDMIAFFEDYTGAPYPWEKYAMVLVDDFMYGGMENTSATTLTSNTIHDERAHLDNSSEGLVAHELAHQWFGDLLTCHSWAHAWLNEGWASYAEGLYMEARHGRDEMIQDLVSSLDWYREAGYTRRMDEMAYVHPDDLFDGHTYIKGAWILHMLRAKLGDEAFKRGVRRYVAVHRGKSVEPDDLRRAFEDATGAQLQTFFEQWVERPGHPQLDVSWRWDAAAKAVKLRVKQKTSAPFVLDVPVQLTGDFGTERWVAHIDRLDQELERPLPGEPQVVEVDRDTTLLMDVTFKKPLWETLVQLSMGGSAESRRIAAAALAHFTEDGEAPKAVKGLGERLGNAGEFWTVRAEAADSIGSLGHLSGKPVLLAALSDGDARVRKAVVEALGHFEGKDLAGPLRKVFRDDPSYEVAAAAVGAYVAAGGEDGLGFAREALGRKSYRETIRKAAINALEDVGGEKAFERVLDETAWGRPTEGRQEAAEVLGRMGSADVKLQERARKRLVDLLLDPRFWVQQSAVTGLKSLGDPKAIEPLERYRASALTRKLEHDADDAIRALKSKKAPQTGALPGAEVSRR